MAVDFGPEQPGLQTHWRGRTPLIEHNRIIAEGASDQIRGSVRRPNPNLDPPAVQVPFDKVLDPLSLFCRMFPVWQGIERIADEFNSGRFPCPSSADDLVQPRAERDS